MRDRCSASVLVFFVVAIIACFTQYTVVAQQQNVMGGKFATRAKPTTTTSSTKKKRRRLLFWRKEDEVVIDRNGKSVIHSLWIKSMKVFNLVDENGSENLHLDESIMFMKAVFVSIFLAYLPSIQRRFERVGEDLATNQANEEGGGEFQLDQSCTCPTLSLLFRD